VKKHSWRLGEKSGRQGGGTGAKNLKQQVASVCDGTGKGGHRRAGTRRRTKGERGGRKENGKKSLEQSRPTQGRESAELGKWVYNLRGMRPLLKKTRKQENGKKIERPSTKRKSTNVKKGSAEV